MLRLPVGTYRGKKERPMRKRFIRLSNEAGENIIINTDTIVRAKALPGTGKTLIRFTDGTKETYIWQVYVGIKKC